MAIDVDAWTDYRDEMWTLAATFRGNGGKLGMLSNGVPEIVARIRADHDLSSLFDAVVISYEVQLAKPEPEIYRVALDRLGVPAFDALFVDDRAENIETARELGLQTLLFTGDVHALRAMTLDIERDTHSAQSRRHDDTKARWVRVSANGLDRPGSGEAARGAVRRAAAMRAANGRHALISAAFAALRPLRGRPRSALGSASAKSA